MAALKMALLHVLVGVLKFVPVVTVGKIGAKPKAIGELKQPFSKARLTLIIISSLNSRWVFTHHTH